jgi:hypothetical protein
MKEIYYYHRDSQNRPFITVCLLHDPETKESARGIAVCSKDDMPMKKRGRGIAYGRALKAMKDGMPRLSSYGTGFSRWRFLSAEYNPQLREVEVKALGYSEREITATQPYFVLSQAGKESESIPVNPRTGLPYFEIPDKGWAETFASK